MDHIEVGNRSHNEVLCVVCVHFMPIPAFIHHWYAFHPPITKIDVGRILCFSRCLCYALNQERETGKFCWLKFLLTCFNCKGLDCNHVSVAADYDVEVRLNIILYETYPNNP